MSFLDKAKPVNVTSSLLTPEVSNLSFASKVRPVMQEEATPNSRGGFLGEVFTGNTQRFGQSTGQALASGRNTDLFSNALSSHSKIQDDLITAIKRKKTQGADASRLEQALQNHVASAPKQEEFTGDVINKSTGNILGEAVGTAVEVTGVGALKGIKGGGLMKSVAKTVEEAATARKTYRALPILGRLKKIGTETAKTAATALPFGYGYDVASGLQDQRGEERTGSKALIPGMGSALSVAIPGGIGALRAGREAVGESLPYLAGNISGEPIEAYKRRQTGQLEDVLKGASRENALEGTRQAVTKYRVGMIKEFGDNIDTISQKYGGVRIGLDDTDAKKVAEVAETFGFDMPQNIKSLSGKEASKLLTNLNEAYIPNASTLRDVQMNNMVKRLREGLKSKAVKAFGGDKGEFATAYKNYATKSDVYKDIANIVGKVGKRTPLQINAARNRLYNIFSENSTGYIDAVKKFEEATGERILDRVAAARLAPLLPKTLRGAPSGVIGLASDALAFLALPLSSPRAGSWLVKQLSGFDEPMLTKLLNKVPGARKAIYDAVNKENMSFSDAVNNYIKKPKAGLGIEDVSKSQFSSRSPVTAWSTDMTTIKQRYSRKNAPTNFKTVKNTSENVIPNSNKNLASNARTLTQPYAKVNSKVGERKIPLLPTKNRQGGFISMGPYKGEKDLTTKILKDLEGKTTVSKQYILDATNRGELKQVERDLIRNMLADEPATINVSGFAKRIKAELLPLKRVTSGDANTATGKYPPPRYESITLPSELRGKVKNYSEQIYESPIKTSAGGIHFSQNQERYFGHTRIEDMADNKTRRVIEVQSDLYQKGNLEKEQGFGDIVSKTKRDKEVAKLQQYNDPTAHFRMVREEIKKAAQDGKTKLQFPTGETAMKIEGLGNQNQFFRGSIDDGIAQPRREVLTPESLKVGESVISSGRDEWIITDVLGDGKFKAMQKGNITWAGTEQKSAIQKGDWSNKALDGLKEQFDISGKIDTNNPIYKFYEKDVQKYLNKYGGKRVVDDKGVSWIEVPIKKEYGKQAVDAFGKVMLNPLLIGAGIGAGAVGVAQANKKARVPFLPNKKKP